MSESTEMCLRTTRSSIVRPSRVTSARRPSSAIPRFTELKLGLDDEGTHDSVDNSSVALAQTMPIYLRLKPQSTKSKRLKKIQEEAYVVSNPSTLLTKFPSLDGSTKKKSISENASRKFVFTHIFSPEIGQLEFFNQSVKQRVVDFLAGQSYTMIAYGTTNSGKTYTLHGNAESPGIIPRSIEFIFSGVDCTLSPWYKPMDLCDVQSLDEAGRRRETEVREKLFQSRSIDRSVCETTYRSMANTMKEERKSCESMYSVWLSFAEIYNENITDLLVDDENQAKVTPLRLMKDKQGRTFIQGLRTMCATTGLEAYQIFVAGQSRLSVGSTSLNPRSSRSHSIFTIKLLKYIKDREPEEVEVSTMTFCDLAGTGRSKKAMGSVNELKEAKNINTSLMVLGRCLKSVVDCQVSKQNVEIGGPFRESKLTRLFQRALTGKENLMMIVNVDTSPDLYVETQTVLNMSTIAKKIIVDTGKDSKFISELPIASPKHSDQVQCARPSSSIVPNIPIKLEEPIKTELEILKEHNAALTKEIDILRETALNREFEIRQEMADNCTHIIKDLDMNWRRRTKNVEIEQEDYLKWSVQQVEIFYKKRIDKLTNRKRRRTSGDDERDNDKTMYEELEDQNSQMTGKLMALQETVKKLKEELEILSADKIKCVFELGLAKDQMRQIRELLDEERGEKIGNDDDKELIDDVRNLIHEKNQKIKRLQERLDASKYRSEKIGDNTTELNITEVKSADAKDSSILASLTIEELEEEINKRSVKTSEIPDVEKSVQNEILEESSLAFELYIDAKFSTSTFKKENPVLPTKFLSESENSMIDDETTNSLSSRNRSIEAPNDESTKNLRSSFFKTISKVFRSSEINENGDDSGIAISNRTSSITENSLKHETVEIGSQTCFENDDKINEKNNEMIQNRVEQLKLDYTKLKTEHLRETIRVTELSQELERIQYALTDLKQMTQKNDEKIIHYREELSVREKDLSDLELSKIELETKLIDTSKQLESKTVAFEKKIRELNGKLKVHEESEKRTSKILEEYLEKSSSLENQLSVAHAQLEKTSIRCFSEHIPKIEKLENELFAKEIRINELDGKVFEVERELARVTELSEKVADFETIFEQYEKEKIELKRELHERLETQTSLSCKLKKLTNKIHERENEISMLRTDLGNVVKMNMENSERATELSEEIAEVLGRTRSEDERRKLDKTSGEEIENLIARLADFEKNATLLARMRDNEDSKIVELDRLKLLLHEKERDMCRFKKNRDKTIRRYETVIRKLQADVEMRCNRESSKLRMLYPKRAISKDSLRSIAGSLRLKSTLHHQCVEKVRSSQEATGERSSNRWIKCRGCHCVCIHPTSSRIIKRSSSHALVTSSTSLEGSRSSGSKNFPLRDDDDEEDDDQSAELEKIETKSRRELNMDMIDFRSYDRREGLSQAAAIFSIPSTSDDSVTDFRNIPEWMEIRRTNGRTHFRMRKGESGITKEDNWRM